MLVALPIAPAGPRSQTASRLPAVPLRIERQRHDHHDLEWRRVHVQRREQDSESGGTPDPQELRQRQTDFFSPTLSTKSGVAR